MLHWVTTVYFAAFVDSTLSTVLNAFPVSPRAIELLHTMSTTIAAHLQRLRKTTILIIKFYYTWYNFIGRKPKYIFEYINKHCINSEPLPY